MRLGIFLSAGLFPGDGFFPLGTPVGPVFHDPVQKSLFKTHILAGLFAQVPLVTEDLFSLQEELTIKRRVPKDRIRVGGQAGSTRTAHYDHLGSPPQKCKGDVSKGLQFKPLIGSYLETLFL